MLLNAVEIYCAVTVIIRDSTLWSIRPFRILLALVQVIDVVIPGRQPDRRHAKFLQIGQVLDHTFKVAAVIVTGT